MENISLYLLWKSAVSLHALYVTGQIYKYCLSMNIAEDTNKTLFYLFCKVFHQLNVLAVKLNLLKIILPRKILATYKCKKIVSCVCSFCQSSQSDVQFHHVASIHALEE